MEVGLTADVLAKLEILRDLERRTGSVPPWQIGLVAWKLSVQELRWIADYVLTVVEKAAPPPAVTDEGDVVSR